MSGYELSSSQKKYLRGLAHSLEPTVRVGRAGLTPPLVNETRRTLEAHELIKVRIDDDSADERKLIAEDLAQSTDATVAGVIGKVAILYRARDENPKIKLPG